MKSAPTRSISQESKTSIEDVLYDDCLLLIMSYLDPSDLLQVEQVNQRWSELSCSAWKHCRDLRVSKTINSEQLNDLLKRTQKKLRALDISKCSESLVLTKKILDSIENYCPDLESLSVADNFMKSSAARIIGDKYPNIKHLNLSYCENVNDKVLKVLAAKCQNLQSLNLQGLIRLTGSCFSDFKDSLKTLVLRGCYGIKPSAFRSIVDHCPELKSLDVSYTNIDTESLTWIAKCLPQLQTLKAEGTDIDWQSGPLKSLNNIVELSLQDGVSVDNRTVNEICHSCKNLRSLDLSDNYLVNNEGTKYLHELVSLEELNIGGTEITNFNFFLKMRKLRKIGVTNCKAVDDEVCLQLLSNLPHLELLDIENSSATWLAEEIAKERSAILGRPVLLHAIEAF